MYNLVSKIQIRVCYKTEKGRSLQDSSNGKQLVQGWFLRPSGEKQEKNTAQKLFLMPADACGLCLWDTGSILTCTAIFCASVLPESVPQRQWCRFPNVYRMVCFQHAYGESGQTKFVPGWLMLPDTVQLGRNSEVNDRVLRGHVSLTAPKKNQGKDNSTLNLEGIIPTLTN